MAPQCLSGGIVQPGAILEVWAEVSNNTVSMLADQVLQVLVDQATCFPLEQGLAQAGGWRPPEAAVGENYWDGWVHLARFKPGSAVFPTGLLYRVQEACSRAGVVLRTLDRRERPLEGVPDRPEIPLRSYQREAVRAALAAGRGVWDMPPRAGKTRAALEWQRCLSLRTVWIVPTKNIMAQTVRSAEEWFGRHYMEPLVGSDWESVGDAPIVVCTAATARQLPAEFYATREVLVLDEVHHAAADTYHQVVRKCAHIYYRLGMTGTFLRSGNDELALHAILSNVVYRITSEELVRLGYLVPADVVFLPVDGPRVRSSSSSFQDGVGRLGIFGHEYRNALAAWAAVTLWSRRLRVLVLVGTKAQGRALADAVRAHVGRVPGARWEAVEFVSTDRPSSVCQEVIDSFVAGTGVQVLVGTSMIGEGTDLPVADALVYAPGGKAEVSHAQAAFRVCTALEGKGRAVIVDFADRHHSVLLSHARERLETYYGQPIFRVRVLDAPESLPVWLDQRQLTGREGR